MCCDLPPGLGQLSRQTETLSPEFAFSYQNALEGPPFGGSGCRRCRATEHFRRLTEDPFARRASKWAPYSRCISNLRGEGCQRPVASGTCRTGSSPARSTVVYARRKNHRGVTELHVGRPTDGLVGRDGGRGCVFH